MTHTIFFLVLKLQGFFFVKVYKQKFSSCLPAPIEIISPKSGRIMCYESTQSCDLKL